MGENAVAAKIDEHLTKVQNVIKASLDEFEESGQKIDRKFIKHFEKVTKDRVVQTCERFEAELKWKTPRAVSVADTNPGTSTANLTNSAASAANSETSPSNSQPKKRKTDGSQAVDSVEAKKAKPNKSTENVVAKEPELQPKLAVFYCVYCFDQSDASKAFNGTVDDVYQHWLANHADNSLSKPFQFYAVTLANCFHCPKLGTYHELTKHHEEEHPAQLFLVTDRSDPLKCGVCHFNDGDLVEHFKKKHSAMSSSKFFNPLHYSGEDLNELVAINESEKCQCVRCRKVFETEEEFIVHAGVAHKGKRNAYDVVEPHQNAPSHLICGYCSAKVKCNEYFHHFKGHTYNYPCSKCPQESHQNFPDLAELIFHEKIKHNTDVMAYHFLEFTKWITNKFFNTKLVFDNGLVLQNYNIQGTKFDESKLFTVFTDELLDLQKQRLKQLNEENEKAQQKRPNGGPKEVAPAVQIHEPFYRSEPAEEMHETLIRHLNDQRKLAKQIHIDKIPSRSQARTRDFLPKIWQRLGMDIHCDNIASVNYRNTSIVVKFHQVSLKNMVLDRCRRKVIWSNELTELNRNKSPWKIEIKQYMTVFYHQMWKTAEEYEKKHALHSFQMTANGLFVKRSATDDGQICLSKQQLINYIENK